MLAYLLQNCCHIQLVISENPPSIDELHISVIVRSGVAAVVMKLEGTAKVRCEQAKAASRM